MVKYWIAIAIPPSWNINLQVIVSTRYKVHPPRMIYWEFFSNNWSKEVTRGRRLLRTVRSFGWMDGSNNAFINYVVMSREAVPFWWREPHQGTALRYCLAADGHADLTVTAGDVCTERSSSTPRAFRRSWMTSTGRRLPGILAVMVDIFFCLRGFGMEAGSAMVQQLFSFCIKRASHLFGDPPFTKDKPQYKIKWGLALLFWNICNEFIYVLFEKISVKMEFEWGPTDSAVILYQGRVRLFWERTQL